MRTDRFACLAAASAMMLALLLLARASPCPAAGTRPAHFCAFAAHHRASRGTAPPASRRSLVLGAVVAFGALDEVHQPSCPARTAELADFLADAAAAARRVRPALHYEGKRHVRNRRRRSHAATSCRS